MNKEEITCKIPNNQIHISKEKDEDCLIWISSKAINMSNTIDELQQQVKKQKEVIDKVTNELFILKDMIYKPETREENFEIQRKISSIIKRLNGKEVSE